MRITQNLLNDKLVAQSAHYLSFYLTKPWRTAQMWSWSTLQPDLIAGITVGLIALPQGVAFALIANLPPEMGLYATIVASIVGALWGSCNQIQTGPANAVSILVLSVLVPVAAAGSPDFIVAAGLVAVLAGLFQLGVGLTRLGVVVNFASHSVIVGFASGAAVLIVSGQLKPLLGLHFASQGLVQTFEGVLLNLPNTHWPTALLGLGTIAFLILMRKLAPKLPGPLIGMALACVVVFLLGLNQQGVDVIGELPRSLPPLVKLPLFNLKLVLQLFSGALAVGTIGLIQTTAIARAITSETGQRTDNNQEFVGQGMANIVAGFFSGYAGAASFARSGVSVKAGAKTSLSAIIAGLTVLLAMLMLAPLGVYLARAVLAGILIIVAYDLIKWGEIKRIWQGAPGDAVIMLVTLGGTLFVSLEFAILVGVLFSFAFYLFKTSSPRIFPVLPDEEFEHFVPYPADKHPCPQLGILTISGDLYFGAANTVEDTLLEYLADHPSQRFLLLRLLGVNNCDFSGIQMLRTVRQVCLSRGGDLYLVKVQKSIQRILHSTGFYEELGPDHFLEEEQAITYLFHQVIDPAVCIYECNVRAFIECQNLPKQTYTRLFEQQPQVPAETVPQISASALWQALQSDTPPLIIDVRQPREFKRGHIPQAQLRPLPGSLTNLNEYSTEQTLVLVCRSGERSLHLAQSLRAKGYSEVKILQGGLLAWENQELPLMIDTASGNIPVLHLSEKTSKQNGKS